MKEFKLKTNYNRISIQAWIENHYDSEGELWLVGMSRRTEYDYMGNILSSVAEETGLKVLAPGFKKNDMKKHKLTLDWVPIFMAISLFIMFWLITSQAHADNGMENWNETTRQQQNEWNEQNQRQIYQQQQQWNEMLERQQMQQIIDNQRNQQQFQLNPYLPGYGHYQINQ